MRQKTNHQITNNMYISKSRSLIKAISWRIVGTLDTMCLGWLITGSPLIGLKIGALELVTKFRFLLSPRKGVVKN